MLVNQPTLGLFIEQSHGDAGDLKALGQTLQLLRQHLGQARQAAQAQLFTDLRREQLALFTAARLSTFEQQVADVDQLQQPVFAQRLHPATQMQRLFAEAEKIQVQALSLPLGGCTFDRQGAMGHEVIEQMRCLRAGHLLRQQMPQRAGQLNHPAFVIQMQLQTDTLHARRVSTGRGLLRLAIEQAPEEFVPGTQNCRLERAVRVAGRLGTEPIPGSTRNGRT